MTNQEFIVFFEKYFEKNKIVETIENIHFFEKKYNLTIPKELKCLLLNFGKVFGSGEPNCFSEKKSYIPFSIDFQNKILNFQISVLYNNIGYIDKQIAVLREREKECHEWWDYENFGIDGFIPIGELLRDSPFFQLFLCCNIDNFGKIYLIDIDELAFDFIDKLPIKIEVANSLVDLILISEKQQQKV